jgi:thioredoxin 1
MESEKLHLVKIGAPWCGPCRQLESILHNLDEEKIGNTVIADVNIDEDDNDDIANEYNVRSIPVTLFIKDNEIVEKYVGSITEADLYNKIEKHK